MFKNKNKVTKISNAVLLMFFVLSLLSCFSLIYSALTGNVTSIEGYTKENYLYDTILMGVYMIVSGILLILLNKKFNIYKDEYPISKQLFNLLIVMGLFSTFILLSGIVIEYFVFNKFSIVPLLTVLFGYFPVYIISFIYVKNNEYFSVDNSTKTNVVNFIIIYLLMKYVINIILIIFELIFKTEDVMVLVKNLILTLIFLFAILLAKKLFDKDKNKVIKKDEEEEPVLITNKPKKLKSSKKKSKKDI